MFCSSRIKKEKKFVFTIAAPLQVELVFSLISIPSRLFADFTRLVFKKFNIFQGDIVILRNLWTTNIQGPISFFIAATVQ